MGERTSLLLWCTLSKATRPDPGCNPLQSMVRTFMGSPSKLAGEGGKPRKLVANSVQIIKYPGGQKACLEKACSTLSCSQAVPHLSTRQALRCLTAEFGRDPVCSTRYGRRRSIYWPTLHGADMADDTYVSNTI